MTATSSPWWIDPLVELLKAGPSLVTAVVAVCGLKIAKAGLSKWRSETIGKRKAEVAEQVLSDFYQAKDIIAAARSPAGWQGEGESRQAAADETETETRLLNSYFRTIERLNNKSEFFAHLLARRYGVIALFGVDAAKPFDEIFSIRGEVGIAARMLMETQKSLTRRRADKPPENIEWEKTIGWGLPDQDNIAPRVAKAVEAMEAVCRPAIQEFDQ